MACKIYYVFHFKPKIKQMLKKCIMSQWMPFLQTLFKKQLGTGFSPITNVLFRFRKSNQICRYIKAAFAI